MKKLLSILLTLSLIISICPMAFAADFDSDGNYDRYIISFENDEALMQINELNETEDIARQNIQKAIEYVKSLSLAEKGYEYIETSCLDQLNNFYEEGYPLLNSYTVCVPKTRASAPRYLGTRNGVDFYYGKYSEYNERMEGNRIDSTQQLQNWANGFVNLILCFGEADFTVPFTLISTVIGSFPGDFYVVGSGDAAEYYWRVIANCYGVYTKSGASYKMWLSCEDGTIRPYVVYHNSNGGNTKNFDAQYDKTVNYGNTQAQLIIAYTMYFEGVDVFRESLRGKVLSHNWK